jgi:hypothetical protein
LIIGDPNVGAIRPRQQLPIKAARIVALSIRPILGEFERGTTPTRSVDTQRTLGCRSRSRPALPAKRIE